MLSQAGQVKVGVLASGVEVKIANRFPRRRPTAGAATDLSSFMSRLRGIAA
jgi:hypothetical protein